MSMNELVNNYMRAELGQKRYDLSHPSTKLLKLFFDELEKQHRKEFDLSIKELDKFRKEIETKGQIKGKV